MPDKFITVSIGRDIPMKDIDADGWKMTLTGEAWLNFKHSIYESTVVIFGKSLISVLVWDSTQKYEGEYEESRLFQIILKETTSDQLVKQFTIMFRRTCLEFKQESVYIGTGSSTLIPITT